jgi:hypothetical protein
LIEGEPFMNVIVYLPNNKEKSEILNNKVAEVYGNTIFNIIEKLKCSKEQKLKLLDEIRICKENNLY